MVSKLLGVNLNVIFLTDEFIRWVPIIFQWPTLKQTISVYARTCFRRESHERTQYNEN